MKRYFRMFVFAIRYAMYLAFPCSHGWAITAGDNGIVLLGKAKKRFKSSRFPTSSHTCDSDINR